jgi:glycosidase
VGVDGFRVDGARHLIEDGKNQTNTKETHAWFKQFFAFYKGLRPDAMTIGEVADSIFAESSYVQNGELDLTFDFELAGATVSAVSRGDAQKVRDTLNFNLGKWPRNQFGSFLTNHDQNRVMTELGGNVEKAKTAALIYLTGPGVPFIYYGEEIGMTGGKPDEKIRTPMQWSAAANAGFSSGTPWEAVNDDYAQKNVEAQRADPNALLAFYRRVVGLRNQHAALRNGDFAMPDPGNGKVFAALRTSANEAILVLANLGDAALKDYRLNLGQSTLRGKYTVEGLLGDGTFAPLTVSEQGGMKDYQPLPELPPGARLVLWLKPG